MPAIPDPLRELVPLRRLIVRSPLCWFPLGPADRALVEVGQPVSPGDPLLERARDAHLVELTVPRGTPPPEPLSVVPRAQAAAEGAPPAGDGSGTGGTGGTGDTALAAPADPATTPGMRSVPPGRVVAVDSLRRVRAAVGLRVESLASPVSGVVEVIDAGAVGVRAAGVGIAGVVMHGGPVHGRLLLLVGSPGEELRAAAVDVLGAGAIVVAGAGLDIETVTRARATGIAGVVTGGIAGKDLGTLAAADERQRASLHPTTGFAVLVIDGYGRRPLPRLAWAWLSAAAGSDAGIVDDPPMLVLGPGVVPPEVADHVRIAAGSALGLEGRLLGAAGQHRSPSGLYGPMARVGVQRAHAGGLDEHLVPFADLERFE